MNISDPRREAAVAKPSPRSKTEALWGDGDSSVEYDPEFCPEIEAPPALKSRRELNRVMQILDDLAVEKLRSENFEQRGAE